MLNQVDPAVIVQIDARTFVEERYPVTAPPTVALPPLFDVVSCLPACLRCSTERCWSPARRVANPEVEIAVALFIKCHNRPYHVRVPTVT